MLVDVRHGARRRLASGDVRDDLNFLLALVLRSTPDEVQLIGRRPESSYLAREDLDGTRSRVVGVALGENELVGSCLGLGEVQLDTLPDVLSEMDTLHVAGGTGLSGWLRAGGWYRLERLSAARRGNVAVAVLGANDRRAARRWIAISTALVEGGDVHREVSL